MAKPLPQQLLYPLNPCGAPLPGEQASDARRPQRGNSGNIGSDDIIKSIFSRFPYLSADVRELTRDDHPQNIYRQQNRFDAGQVAYFSAQLDEVAHGWASKESPGADHTFTQAIEGLRLVVKAVSATSLMLRHGSGLLVERPGFEVETSRRGELTEFVERTSTHWARTTIEDRLALAQLSLLGLSPLQLELVNYLEIDRIPSVLGRLVSRICQLGTPHTKGLNITTLLTRFYEIEERVLDESGLTRTTIPGGTRPRIYVPKEMLSPHKPTLLRAQETLKAGTSRIDSLAQFLALVWAEFSDETFLVLHEGQKVNALGLFGGCIYSYVGLHVAPDGEPKMKNDALPTFVRTAGKYEPRRWRRRMERLCFEGGTPATEDFRSGVIVGETLPPDRRAETGRTGIIAKAAQKLFTRQVNYNMSSVLNGRMERISADEWAPFMCRDCYGKIYNTGHALAGVGEMFRGLLRYGGRFSQFRCWREVDGTHGFADITKYLAYKTALDAFLSANDNR